MKVGLISNMFPSKKSPVFGVFVQNTEKLLSENGIKTISKSVIYGKKKGFSKLLAYISLYFGIFKIYFNEKVDLVYVHFPLQTSPLLLILNNFSNKKLVLNIHGSELNESSFFYSYFKKLLHQSNLLIVPSKIYKKKIIELFDLKEEKIYVYPSGGVDTSVFYQLNKADVRKKFVLNEDDFICAYISSIIKNKGWKTFVNAANLLKHLDIKFLVVGNGSDENLMKNKVKEMNVESSFIFFDKQVQTELVKYYSVSDVFIFPTQKESLGLVGVEALSCGVPVIASNIEATAEYINDGVNGFLFEKENAKSLAEKIEKFYHSSEKELFSKQALKTAAKFDSKNCSFALAQKLKQL